MMIAAKRAKDEEETVPYCHAHWRYHKRFHCALSHEDRQLWQRRTPRISLQGAHESSWRWLYYSEQSGLDHADRFWSRNISPASSVVPANFWQLHAIWRRGLHQKISPRGRKRTVTALDVLGLVHAWTRTRGALLSLQMHFGLSMTNLTMYLRFGCRIIVEVLRIHLRSSQSRGVQATCEG